MSEVISWIDMASSLFSAAPRWRDERECSGPADQPGRNRPRQRHRRQRRHLPQGRRGGAAQAIFSRGSEPPWMPGDVGQNDT